MYAGFVPESRLTSRMMEVRLRPEVDKALVSIHAFQSPLVPSFPPNFPAGNTIERTRLLRVNLPRGVSSAVLRLCSPAHPFSRFTFRASPQVSYPRRDRSFRKALLASMRFSYHGFMAGLSGVTIQPMKIDSLTRCLPHHKWSALYLGV